MKKGRGGSNEGGTPAAFAAPGATSTSAEQGPGGANGTSKTGWRRSVRAGILKLICADPQPAQRHAIAAVLARGTRLGRGFGATAAAPARAFWRAIAPAARQRRGTLERVPAAGQPVGTRRDRRSLDGGQRLVEVGQQVVDMLDADR